MDRASIDRDLELGGVLESPDDVQVGPIELRLKLVLGVERERVLYAQTTDRAERKAVDVLVLREVLSHAIRLAHRTHLDIAHGKPTDPARRRQVALLQRRRYPEDIGDVVEPV